MDFLFEPLAASFGASTDQVKLISCLLASYPLGSVFIRIPTWAPVAKHLFNLAVAVFYFIPVLNLKFAFVQLLGDVLATYYIAKKVQGPRMPWIVFFLNMGHLMVNHIIRAFANQSYETVEITGSQMVLVMKLTTFAWNVLDGRRPAEELDKWQLKMRVTTFPSLLAFLGYSFYFPGVLVGPYIEYAAYTSLIDGTLFEVPMEANQPPPPPRRRLIPDGRKRVAYKKGLLGVIYLGLFVALSGKFNYSVALADWFVQYNFFYRVAYYQICGFFERAKYYGIWTLTEGAAILTGFGFTGFTPEGRTRWEGAANIDVLAVEFPSNFKMLIDSWNMKTNVWLRECMYKRVTPKGRKPGFRSSMTTFATSALWHGIAPGYYITFICGGFVQTAGRLCRSHFRPLFLPVAPAFTVQSTNGDVPEKKAQEPPSSSAKKDYDVAGTLATILIVNFVAAPFLLGTLQDSIEAWRRLRWYGLWMIGSCLTFFYCGGGSWLKGVQARRAKAATGVAMQPSDIHSGVDRTHASVVPPVDSAVLEARRRVR